MQSLTPKLTQELQSHVEAYGGVGDAPGFPVKTYRDLVQHVARLAYLNKDHLLFFRGQSQDHRNRAGSTTLYPSIYRGDPTPRWEVRSRFDRLEAAGAALATVFKRREMEGAREVARRKTVQWGILQHYEVVPTPLLDLTHSITVACSFAGTADNAGGLVYVLGLPQLTNRISVNSEVDIVTVRLLSICPPDALRPYFQEGYLVGTPDVTADYSDKSELDVALRLIAKFQVTSFTAFLGKGLRPLPTTVLYPKKDVVQHLCEEVQAEMDARASHSEVGEFLEEWIKLEQVLLQIAEPLSDRVLSARHAVSALRDNEKITKQMAARLDQLRLRRNAVAHGKGDVAPGTLRAAIREIGQLRRSVLSGG